MSNFKSLLIAFFSLAASGVFAQDAKVDSLQKLLFAATVDTVKVSLLNEISACLWYADPNESVEYAEQAMLIAQQNNYQYGLLKAYNNIGVINDSRGNYGKALEYYIKSLEISRDLGDTKSTSKALNNIGVLYESLGEYKQALDYHQQSLEIKGKLQDEQGIGSAYNNMGIIYKELGETEKALEYHRKALSIREKLGYQRGIANSLSNIGKVYLLQDKLALARECFERSLEIAGQLEDKNGQAYALLNLAAVYYREGDVRKAIYYARKSFNIYHKLDAKEEVKEACKLLYESYLALQDYRNAFKYQASYLKFHDSLTSEETKNRIAYLQSSFEIQKRDGEIMMLNKDKKISEAETKRLNAEAEQKNLFLFASFTFLTFLVLLAIVLVRYNRQHKHVNYLLNKKNEDIRHANFDLHAKNKEVGLRNEEVWEQKIALEELNGIKDRLFSIIAHDFRSPLNSLQGTLALLQMEAISYTELKDILPGIIHKVDHTVSLLDNLLNWARTQMSGMKTKPVDFNLQTIIEENVYLLKSQANEKGILIHNLISPAIPVFADQEMIKLVVRNLLTNAVKYTSPGDVISVKVQQVPGFYQVAVVDTGCGIDKDKLSCLFEPGKGSTPGTHNEKGTGLGLWMCKDFVEKNGGEIWAESERSKGSTFYFTIPKGEHISEDHAIGTAHTVYS